MLKSESKGGMVEIKYSSLLEHRLAAAFSGYSWTAFSDLTGDPLWCELGEDSKAMVVATYRCHQHMSGVQQWR